MLGMTVTSQPALMSACMFLYTKQWLVETEYIQPTIKMKRPDVSDDDRQKNNTQTKE